MRRSLLAFVLVALHSWGQSTAAPSRRIAFLFGNSSYAAPLKALPSVPEEMKEMETALKEAGFTVILKPDFRLPEFFGEGEKLIKDSVHPGDVCLIYYSGYALGWSGDDTYLLPVVFNSRENNDIEIRALRFKLLQGWVKAAKPSLTIFVMEASRATGLPPQQDVWDGPIPPEVQDFPETYWASATTFQATSAVSSGLSAFTRFWARHMQEPLTLPETFEATRRDVYDATRHEQNPSSWTSLGSQQFRWHDPPPPGPRLRVPYSYKRDREEYVWIQSGKFLMGCAKGDANCEREEKEQHPVTISKPFWIGRNEVQVGSYMDYLVKVNPERKAVRLPPLKMPSPPGHNPGWKKISDPMVNIRWEDASGYCKWAGGDLPTEAQWEYAYRAAGKDDQIYPGGIDDFRQARDHANFAGRAGNDVWDDEPAPVRKFDPNGYGIYDMAGNVWEWVGDRYSKSGYTREPQIDPTGPAQGSQHVIRGGGYAADPKTHLRLSVRSGSGSDSPELGFRCALPDTPEIRKNLIDPERQ